MTQSDDTRRDSEPTAGEDPTTSGNGASEHADYVALPTATGLSHLRAVVRRNVRWVRQDGVRAFLEEHDLNPLVRIPREARRRRWARDHGRPGEAVAVLLVGVQRSGTNMLTHGLDEAPQVQVHNEGDGAAFERYRIRPLDEIARMVTASPHRVVLFKPLCDSHRTDELLDGLAARTPGPPPRAIWAWRGVDGRVRSAVEKFESSNLQVLRAWSRGQADDHWQVQRLSDHSREVIASVDLDAASAEDGAALFWYVRNRLLLETGLAERDDVVVVGYDAFLADPTTQMRRITDAVGLEFDPAHVGDAPRSRWTCTRSCASTATG